MLKERTKRMLRWYALQVQSRLAKTASAALKGKGYEEFLPLCRSSRRWSDRIKEIDVALFPGYLFCRFDPEDRLVPVLTTPGVMGIVSACRRPLEIANKEIESVRKMVASGLVAERWPFVQTGCRVVLERGPLEGLDGIVIRTAGIDRVVVSISLLQRSVATEIDRSWVRCTDAPLVSEAVSGARLVA